MLKLRFESFRAFIEEYSSRISEEGMFLATDAVQEVGTSVEFEISLSDDFRLLHGVGEVVWKVSPKAGSKHPAGMAVRFKDTDEPSRRLIARLVDNHRKAGGSPFVLGETPIEAFQGEGAEASPGAPTAPIAETPTEAADLPALKPLEELETMELDLGQPETAAALSRAFEAPPDAPAPPPAAKPLPPDFAEEVEPGPPPPGPDAGAPPGWPGETAEPGEPDDLLSVPEIPAVGEAPPAPEEPAGLPWATAAEPAGPEPAAPEPAADAESKPPEPTIDSLRPPGLDEAREAAPYEEYSSVRLAGAASARARPAWIRVALIVAAVAVAAFAGAYFFADDLKTALGWGVESEVAAGPGAEPPESTRPRAEPEPAEPAEPESPSTEGAAPAAGTGPEGAPASSGAAAEPGVPPAAGPAPPSPPAQAPAPAPTPSLPADAALAPLTGVDRITWETPPGETVVILWADAPIRPGDYELLRVESPPPREVIKVFGVSRRFAGGEIALGTPEVLRLRTGLHDRPGGQDLHIVADLAGSEVAIASAETAGNRLLIRFTRK